VNNKKNLLYTGLLLSLAINGATYSVEHKTEKTDEKAAQSLNSHHAKHIKFSSKNGFNPPRQISPEQFRQSLKNNQPISEFYRSKPALLSKQKTSKLTRSVITSCTSPAELQTLSGDDLINSVKSGVLNSCLYGLFDKSLVGTNVFTDASITTIASAINTHLASYDGTDASSADELEKLVIYLRAMHWAEWGNNRVFPVAYNTALNLAFSNYFAGEHFITFSGDATRNFMVRYEILVLLRSSGSNSMPFIARLTDALVGYAETVNQDDGWGVYYEENGLTQILTHLFNASEDNGTELEQAVISSPRILSNLQQFVETKGTWLIGHTREYQWADTVNELARFLRFGGDIANTVRPNIQKILSDYNHQGAGSSGWLKAQSAIGFYDSENCNLYGEACSFDLEATILSGDHTCSSSLKLRFQPPIANDNLTEICQNLTQQEVSFHQLFDTNTTTPVADDQNSDLEVVIFSSYTDYDNYAGNFFGIGTDNGGMYLEGDPWVENNQARFIAHQATWLPGFSVWNLKHEYVHYLDGRFNKWGNFNDQADNSVWWAEGLAEYLSQPNDNPNALTVAAQGTYDLSELFQTTYENSNTERTYYWGYLATRFMLETQRPEVDNTLLPSFRAVKYVIASGDCQFDWGWKTKTEAIANNWSWAHDDSEWSSGSWVWTCGQPKTDEVELPEFTPYQDILASWGTTFDQDFSDWLVCLVAGDGLCQEQATKPGDLDGNNAVDIRDINLFKQLLRGSDPLPLEYDFNKDGNVDRRDVRPMMALCDLSRCAIAS